jgi:hypothetical protein
VSGDRCPSADRRPRAEEAGGRITTLIAALGTLSVGLAVSADPGRPWSVAFLLIAPAAPAAVLWRAVDLWVRLVLAGAVAVIVDGLVAEVMLVTQTWSLSGGIAAVAVISALLWIANAVAWNTMAVGRTSSSEGAEVEAERERVRPS